MSEKVYQVTKETCQQFIDRNGNVCDHCGGQLSPIETVDNAGNPTYWSGCWHGNPESGWGGIYTAGVPRELFELAEKLVLGGERAYSHLDKSEYRKDEEAKLYWFRSQVSGMCSHIRRIEYLKQHDAQRTIEEFLAAEF